MRRTTLGLGVGLVVAAGALAWIATMPRTLASADLADMPQGDAQRGALVFWAGGCASCHGAVDPATGIIAAAGKLTLSGGLHMKTPFGTFVTPNISSDAQDGIGGWSQTDFANAMLTGTSPQGGHYYPAFPYTSYARMSLGDVSDLFAFMQTVEPVSGRPANHELDFPFNIRRGIGLWKRLNLSPEPVMSLEQLGRPAAEEDLALLVRGRYLVEGPGHCGACHTPRDALGSLDLSRWLDGAPAPAGDGKIPGLSPGHGLDSWSVSDIAYYLESGFTPDYDSVGGEMAAVQANIAKLPARDREAIATYLKALPVPGGE
ncbi:cytochrome c [Roseibium sp. CAU 1637]|uniref:Cytochrome c n=1 Tax=Roseibium limicola TaxID=2816037 RepID=A0A939J8V0_9HYPH|nr:cytochrome c [Roseibium limicola]MBO0345249.1 cytochrome c [Roseibium limicola]